MKIQIISVEEKALLKRIQSLPKQQAFAQMKAVNETMNIAHKDLKAEVAREFDKPTRWFINSTRVGYASKTNPQAYIAPKDKFWTGSDSAERIYMLHVFGGQRKDKRSESQLKQRGLLPQSKNLIIARFGIRKNINGNITGGMMNKILSGLRAQLDPYSNSHKNSRSKGNSDRWAYTTIRGVTGIWDVSKRKPKLYFYEAPRAVYKPRLRYFETIDASVNANFDMLHARWIKRAMKTAR
ncbi:hypothetical protein [Thiomicrorhabdus lithotrophica]|uniref:HK97 gp10 family phage protein n=1 Tax=Thiomicrorhabdus lithotrophica TaxID=2949997 RepID=A0ABY8C9E7_9GAMM|nr:hypothetical protein [Thiomicrorhabdus lithotrophica]WEJ62157.1 hypothetical protein NR989_09065 [Thiomicrorhabdus lithotrophica]